MPYQQIIVQGTLGRDVESRFMPNGDPVASFSIAVTEKYKDKENTEWFNCTAFGKTAEIAGKYLSKGGSCMVIGRQRTEKYQDKDGNDKTSIKLIVDRLVLTGSKQSGGNSESKPAQQSSSGADMDGDDIPFASINRKLSMVI